jgi:hypothetical protein
MFATERAKLESSKCKKCGFEYGEHAIATPEEVELLRSLGYGLFICKGVAEYNHFLEGPYVEIVAVSSEGVTLNTCDLEKMFKEPDNPCDSDFMEDISS